MSLVQTSRIPPNSEMEVLAQVHRTKGLEGIEGGTLQKGGIYICAICASRKSSVPKNKAPLQLVFVQSPIQSVAVIFLDPYHGQWMVSSSK